MPVLQIMEYVLSIAAIARAWSSYLATLCSKVSHTFCKLTSESKCRTQQGNAVDMAAEGRRPIFCASSLLLSHV